MRRMILSLAVLLLGWYGLDGFRGSRIWGGPPGPAEAPDLKWSPSGSRAVPRMATEPVPIASTPAGQSPAPGGQQAPPAWPTLPPSLPLAPAPTGEAPALTPPPAGKPASPGVPEGPAAPAGVPSDQNTGPAHRPFTPMNLPPGSAGAAPLPAPEPLPFTGGSAPLPPVPDHLKAAAPATPSALPAATPTPPAPSLPDLGAVGKPAVPAEQSSSAFRPVAPVGAQTPTIYLEKIGPPTVAAGKPFAYEIVARNTGTVPVFNVRVEDEIPAGGRFVSADPKPEMHGERLAWSLGTLDVGGERRIKVEIQAVGEGDLTAAATVTFSAASGLRTQIIRPKLALTVTGPEGVQVGDQAEFQIKVANVGTGPATNVVLHDNLPPGLWHSQGHHIDADLGTLAPGEAKVVPLPTTAVKAGPQVNETQVTADDGLKASAQSRLVVTEAVLSLTTSGPKRRYLNREAQFTIELANSGSAPASGVVVTDQLPEGLEFVATSEGGAHDPATRTVRWQLDAVPPAQKRTLWVKVLAKAPGDLVTRATAQATRGRELRAEAAVRVEGMAALVCEVVDLENPIEVGAETTYEIRVFNQGTAPSTGVQVIANLPRGLTAKGATGPVPYHVQGQQVVFEPLPKLAPRADTVYRVRLAGLEAGDLRVKVLLTSDQVRVPVCQEEVTHVYNDRDDLGPAARPGAATPEAIRKVSAPGAQP